MMGDEAIEVISELIHSFLRDAPKQIVKMKDGVVENDREVVLLAAHTLKGSSANIGAEFLSSTSFELEMTAESDDIPLILSKINNIENAFNTTKAELQRVASNF